MNTLYVPTNALLAIVVLNTSTPKTSAIISSLSLSNSGCTRATWSLQLIQLPNAEILSSSFLIRIESGKEFLNHYIS